MSNMRAELNSSNSMEKDFAKDGNGHYHLGPEMNSDTALKRIQTAGSISISPELFEKIYLQPQNQVAGDLRKTFGNPTPLALLGFLLSLTPLAFDLMGLGGAGTHGAATVGVYYFIGGLLMFSGGILEFFLGNTFPFVVFCSFGGFWFSYGATLTPSFGAFAWYAKDKADVSTNPYQGFTTKGFEASFGFYMVFMGLMSFMYLICALRTNIVFVAIFLGLTLDFALLAGVFFQEAHENSGASIQTAAGAMSLATVAAGWYIFFAQMLTSVDFPIELPVGDLSQLIRGASEKRAKMHAV